MKKLLFTFFIACSCLSAIEPQASFDQKLVIQNRVLMKIGGKPLTVYDVVRRMDVLFTQQYPEHADNQIARYQFYQSNWRRFFTALIDEKLILQDAKERKITANEGEVRRSFERYFGKDPIISMEKMGISLDEAYEIVESELIVQKMNGGLVFQRANTAVTPKRIQELYKEYCTHFDPKENYRYQLISFRGQQQSVAKEKALAACEAIKSGELTFDALPSKFSDQQMKLSLSEEYTRSTSEISHAHKAVLDSLSPGEVSSPILRNGTIYLFCLHEYSKQELKPFSEMENELMQVALQEQIMLYSEKYRKDLRERFGFTEKEIASLVPQEFSPFALL